ncbi:quinolinate synthase NadA [Wenyingzhuangia marina]|uniref:Quinolinate synthase n=1 Tax=Wenyingzhuangia marina TaxID=1195760 RepID=A0A1M5WS39_9FLAO|nr:quinolinate synthase NadA [Wenyingzhuangia marina]GGF80104.1 quinolinate synthase A [Wenyingzhuangia marina]SHH89924.1 quinolinate synthetase [Wenyingzhuangia marina]
MDTLAKAKENLNNKGFLDIETKDTTDYVAEINRLKKEKNAVILAHYYQEEAIQDIADFVGDSLQLAQEAAKTDADVIVFCGVHFMAETAKILNPKKKVLLPDLKAGCSLADSCPPEEFKAFKAKYPDHKVVTYINCSAEIKTMSDIVCTSSNAVKIINSFPKDQKIIFAPDKNLGDYLNKETGRDMVLWDGACMVHEAFSIEKLLTLAAEHPDAEIIAHPESPSHILKTASYIGSTAGLLKYARESKKDKFIVATEAGILHEMIKQVPNKHLIPAPAEEDNSCACSECFYMRMNTMKKLFLCLEHELPAIEVDEKLAADALLPIERMLALSK